MLKKIPVIIFGIIFLMSSTGIVVFQSYCSCTGNEQVSLYITPETCETVYHHKHAGLADHVHEESSAEHHCGDCSMHLESCGCGSPVVRILKIDDRFVNEKVRVENEVMFAIPAPVVTISDTCFLTEEPDIAEPAIDPPPRIQSSLDFLIRIQQLKIHCTA